MEGKMSTKFRAKPFGLIFEEAALPPIEQMQVSYDEDMDLSFVEGRDGMLTPLVESARCLATQTETKVRSESTDSDPGNDYEQKLAITMGTETITLVDYEDSDSDDDQLNDLNSKSRKTIFFGTETFTEIEEEQTDSDE